MPHDIKSPPNHNDAEAPNGSEKQPRTRIKRSQLGVWDFYEELEVDRPRFALAPLVDKLKELVDCLPYLMRVFKDVLSIPGCASLVIIYAAAQLSGALVPAATIWQALFTTINVPYDTHMIGHQVSRAATIHSR